jgi:hypothetical protein
MTSSRNIRRTGPGCQKPYTPPGSYTINRHGRFWAVLDPAGELLCLTVYKRGAEEVTRRLFHSTSDENRRLRAYRDRPARRYQPIAREEGTCSGRS